MRASRAAAKDVDEYISGFPRGVQATLKKIRLTIRRNAPGAEEVVSYRMPAFKLNGILLYFAAFKNHIGVYPPVAGDPGLEKALAPYAGPKGNLKFPLDQPFPYGLLERVVNLRVRQNLARVEARRRGGTARKRAAATKAGGRRG
jgi:uncharacterized protein YdhG (YjbR/CyaY superfamily)